MKPNGTIKNIPCKLYNWGPCLFSTEVSKKVVGVLSEEITYATQDAKKTLAGVLGKQIAYTTDSRNRIGHLLAPYFHAYLQFLAMYRGKDVETPNLSLEQLWCSYQYPGDYNPPHQHSGRFSFVIYLHMDNALVAENNDYQGTDVGPGGITFSYGEGFKDNITQQQFFPKPYQMFIFPSWLTHFAAPYRHPNIVRTSVSGNVYESVDRAHIEKSGGKNITLSDTMLKTSYENTSN